jgi:hypothetical protein
MISSCPATLETRPDGVVSPVPEDLHHTLSKHPWLTDRFHVLTGTLPSVQLPKKSIRNSHLKLH